ncbi:MULTISPECIES: DsrE family protein [unclassified Thioalkalivibrio]|uniref:DsrE family protein n=1 Tax=unclassified Thioalkalivibrio TaxID=2621013 RepID=UPI0003650D6D|nr:MULTISPECIES: DsrE family protein [unclassified Thioalkalivibrio]
MKIIASLFLLLTLSLATLTVQAEAPTDARALDGVEQGRVVFDLNNNDPEMLALYLMVIRETFEDLTDQGVDPDMILAFRGRAVTMVSEDRERFELTDFDHLDAIEEHVAALKEKGVRMESCAVATRLFGVEHGELLPGIEPVRNTFVSLTGYQAQGYAVIPIY